MIAGLTVPDAVRRHLTFDLLLGALPSVGDAVKP